MSLEVNGVMIELFEGVGFLPPKDPVKWFAVLTEPDGDALFWVRHGRQWAQVRTVGERSLKVVRAIGHWSQL